MRVVEVEGLLDLLDEVFEGRADATSRAASEHWNGILLREGHPLNTDRPDASLVEWHRSGLLPMEKVATALDVGCGLGRNSRWMAGFGASVTGIDIAASALEAARGRGEGVEFREVDFLREVVPGGPFELVYDSGCFHHLAPHRRISYLKSLREVLAPGGYFGICTFTSGLMGSDEPDDVLMRSGRLGEGVGYTEAELAEMFSWLDPIAAGPMPGQDAFDVPVFTQDFLTVALFRNPAEDDQ
ncbi:methyltransferase domain-containing protein [Kribbella sp. NBC_01245]|uniref:class I SAM-dependent methyltransferase n=1 Tax=Kribbella sp. NBC_01245 TaxID=2903578 RepID=UPI002E2A8472|nr:methyltransferase domain-containing protein [Kribbella sp. NBC_01245]